MMTTEVKLTVSRLASTPFVHVGWLSYRQTVGAVNAVKWDNFIINIYYFSQHSLAVTV